jgi:hypothetical protein
MPVKEALFSQLYEELNQAINALRKKNLWEQAFYRRISLSYSQKSCGLE